MNDDLDSYIERVEHLPATPGVVVRLIGLFRQPEHEVDEIVELMRQDPSLTAEVLRHCNSAYFAWEEPIADVFEAIMRLGFYEVYQIAVTMFGLQTLSAPQRAGSIGVKSLWRHSAATAVMAGVIARKVDEPEGMAFTAGLLHDVGKIVLALKAGAAYAAVTDECEKSGAPLQETESKRFGFGHSEVGARLLERWGVPVEISVPVRCHHDASWLPPLERLCAIVSLGNAMAHAADAPSPENQNGPPEARTALRVLRLEQDDMAPLLQDAQKELERFSGLFGRSKLIS